MTFANHKMLFWNLYYGTLNYLVINEILFLAFEKMKLKHSLDQLLASSALLPRSDQDDDSGSHSMKELKPLG